MKHWADIPTYEGLYQVSMMGNVRSLDRLVTDECNGGVRTRWFPGRPIMPQRNCRTGYWYVMLQKNGVRKNVTLHRLVAKVFLANPENKPEVHHKREPKTNNRASNLKWVTTAEHHALTVVLGQQTKGSRHGMSKLNEPQVTKIRQLAKQGQTRKEVAALFNVSTDMVGRIVRRQNWTHIPLEAIA